MSDQSLDRAAAAVAAAASAAAGDFRCQSSVEAGLTIEPVHMDPDMIETLERVCDRSGRPWRRISSGAGHDAGAMAAHVPAGMLFVPSRGGISHSPLEHTDDGLLIHGCGLLLAAVLALVWPEQRSIRQ
jgi:N-carbamoyl-L-amino-acid hydrolase